MPRVARAKSSSGYYHVMARGSGGQLLFECGEDYAVFLESLGSCADEHSVSLIAYCLMPNHVHLLVRDGDDELGEMMRSLLSGYAQSYNKRTGHVGHVFQQRFKSCPVESDEYLLQLVRYMHENPAKAGICKAEEYWWSSYHESVTGSVRVDTNLVLSMVRASLGSSVSARPLSIAVLEGCSPAFLIPRRTKRPCASLTGFSPPSSRL